MTRAAGPAYAFGPFCLYPSEQRLTRDGKLIRLTPKAFDVLTVLVSEAGHLVEKEELLRRVWAETFVEEGNLNRIVSVLRKVLADGVNGAHYIETIPKRGYRFVAAVREIATKEGLEQAAHPAQPGPRAAPGLKTSTTRRLAAFLALILVFAAVAGFYFYQKESSSTLSGHAAATFRKVSTSGREGTPAISPDGTLIASVRFDSPNRKILVQERIGSGAPIVLFEAPEVGNLRWSPNGTELLFWARGGNKDGLYAIRYPGGNARKVFSGPFVAGWAPDGNSIAVAGFLVGKITILDALGRPKREFPLEGVVRWIADLDWSGANGRILLAYNDHRGKHTISTISADGSDQRKLLEGSDAILGARWAKDGRHIYFMRQEDQTASLYRLAVNTTDSVQQPVAVALLSGLETDGDFGLSADGRYFVYARSPFYSNLWKIDLKKSGSAGDAAWKELTFGTSVMDRPAISPDGKRVLFSMGTPSVSNLFTVAVEGGTPEQLTFFKALSNGGVWSPDGTRVAFASNEGGTERIWVIGANGGPPFPVSRGQVSDTFALSWAPGADILYQKTGNHTYYRLKLRNMEEALLVEENAREWAFNAIYSPDRTKIAIAWSHNKKPGIWILKDGKETLAVDGPMLELVGWSPDGTKIYALDGKRAAIRPPLRSSLETLTEARVLEVPLDGRPAKTLIDLPFAEVGGVSVSPQGDMLICVVYTANSDIWLSESFQP